MLNTDEETFQYVLRQLCRKLGNTKFLVRPRPQKKKTKSVDTRKSNVSRIMSSLARNLSTKQQSALSAKRASS